MSDDWSHSTEAEQSLLGGLLLDNSAFAKVVELIAPGDFYTEDHSAIFRAIGAIVRRAQPADVVTVCEALKQNDLERFERLGGAAYVGALAQNTPSALHIRRYAELVRERSLSRRLHAMGAALQESARASAKTGINQALGLARAALQDLAAQASPAGLAPISAPELLNAELEPLEVLVAPFLFQKCLAMVHARRGVGKTHFALALAFALASGGKFLNWSAPKARGVLYIDGEMPQQLMQARIRELASAAGEVPELLRIITPDRIDRPMPDLATAAGQAEVDAHIGPATALIVVDNLSCLVRSGGAENESESWTAVADWLLRHRRAGRAVLVVHHSGKGGAQRGTSKREDLLDVVINLRRPPEHQESDGCVFTIHFEKARSVTGEDIAPIEARLEQLVPCGQSWTWRAAGPAAATTLQARIVELWETEGMTINDVAKEARCGKSHASRTLTAAMAAGTLKRPYPARRRLKEGTN